MQWCCVIQRRRRQVNRVLVDTEEGGKGLHVWMDIIQALQIVHRQHALGLAGGARGIQHRRTIALVCDALSGHRCGRLLPGVKAWLSAVDHVEVFNRRDIANQLVRYCRKLLRTDEQLRVAILEDVLGLFLAQVRADRRKDQATPHCALHDLHELGIVLDHHADMITALEPVGTKQLGNAVGTLVQFGIGGHLAGIPHDDCRLVWGYLGGGTDVGHNLGPLIICVKQP